MAYTKQIWHDLPQTDTPINASRLAHIEDGIESVEQEIPQVVNTRSDSQVDAYSCDYINGKVLYDSSSGTTGNITLIDNLANYTKIEITFKSQDDTLYNAIETKIYDNPNNKNIIYNRVEVDKNAQSFYLTQKLYSCSGIAINRINSNFYQRIPELYNDYDNIRIIKVVGYKK